MRLLPSLRRIPNGLGYGRGPRSRRSRTRLACEALETRRLLTGTWTELTNAVPGGTGAGTMLLLSNGSVIVQGGNNQTTKSWYELTPDSTGSYVNGTWKTIASMNVGRRFYGSDVLPDGDVYVVGGEYATDQKETNSGEIYDPSTNTWTTIAPYSQTDVGGVVTTPESQVGDGMSETLPGGDVLQANSNDGNLYIYDPGSNTWSTSSSLTLPNSDSSGEEGWVKLPDGSLLQYEIGGTATQTANRLVLGATESQDSWTAAGSVPVALQSNGGDSNITPELGPGVLLPDGQVFWMGASGHTALYSMPTAAAPQGTWTKGPDILDANNNLLGAFDAPAAVEPDGKVLFSAGPINGNTFPGPTTVFEYDPSTNKINEVTVAATAPQPDLNYSEFESRMLVLPSGQILFSSGFDNNLYVYNPTGTPSASWAPTVSNITWAGGSSFTLTGTQLNGLDEGAAYGDDVQMAENYPIVKLVGPNGAVTFATTSNWSSEWVATGQKPETTEFSLPSQDGPGVYTLSVIADGIASRPVMFVVGSAANDTVTVNTATFPIFNIPLVSVDLDGTTTDGLQAALAGIFVATEGGNDTVDINHTVAGIPVGVSLGGGTDTVYVAASTASLDAIASAVTVDGSGTTQLFIEDQQDNEDSFTPGLVTDTLTGSTLTRSATGALLLNGPSVTRVTTINYAGLADLTLDAGAAPNEINVDGTSAPTTIDAGSGNQQVAIGPDAESLDDINGLLAINGSGHTQLLVDDQRGSSPGLMDALVIDTLTGTSLTRTGAAISTGLPGPIVNLDETIVYAGLAGLTLNAGAPATFINVQSTSVPTTVSAGSGITQVSVSPALKSLDSITASLTVNGGGGTQLIIDDQNANLVNVTPLNVIDDITSSSFSRSALGILPTGGIVNRVVTINYGGLAGLTLNAGAAQSFITVDSTSAPTTVNAGAGNQQVNVSPTAESLDSIAATLTVNGGGHTQLVVDDQNADRVNVIPISVTDDITGSALTRSALGLFPTGGIVNRTATINYGGLAGLTLNAGAVLNFITVDSTSTPTTVNAGAGNQQVNVSPTLKSLDSITASLTVNGGGGTQLIIDDQNANLVNVIPVNVIDDLTSSSFSRSALGILPTGGIVNRTATINYGGLAGLTLNAGAAQSFITVDSTSAPTTVNAGAGNQLVNVSPTAESLDSIAATLTVNGGGHTQLVVDDQNADRVNVIPISVTDDITGSALTRSALGLFPTGGIVNRTATINYGGLAGLTLNAGAVLNFITVDSTSTPTTVNAGAGNQQVNVSPTAETLDSIAAPLTVSGGGHTQLVINDQKANTTRLIRGGITDVLTADTLTRTNRGIVLPIGPLINSVTTINYGGLAGLTLNAGAKSNTINVETTAVPTTIDAGTGTSTVSVCPTFESLSLIGGPLTVNGDGAAALVINDQKTINNTTYTINAGTFQSSSISATITDSNLSALIVNGGGGGADRYVIGGTGAVVATTINGLGGNNTLVGPNVAGAWNITGSNAGNIGNVTFGSIANLTGGTGLDAFVFGAGASVSGRIDGGGGGDWLDYATYTTPVAVNLTAGTATGVGGGIVRIQEVRGGQDGNNLTGSSQGNVLIGGSGSNTIVGGSGRSLLIGGGGSDSVTGGSGGDILIAGTTSYDSSSLANDIALEAILTEWQSTESYVIRISNIKSGVGSGDAARLVWGTTVFDNPTTSSNTLTGAGGMSGANWFLANISHTRTNKTWTEALN